MVSEHASPLAILGGVDAGGQNVHVAALATALAHRGDTVVVHTRRDDARLPRHVALAPGVTVDHVPAGPAHVLPKDELLPYVDALAADLHRQWRADPPDVVHAHFWMSGVAALAAARPLGIPVAHTFHALGVVKQRHQHAADTSPPTREQHERDIVARADHLVATCSDEVFELLRLGADRHRTSIVPCGVDLSVFTPDGATFARTPGRRRLLVVGRLVERKGVRDVIAALGMLRESGGPDTELLVAGGPHPGGLDADPEVAQLRQVARECGVADRVHVLGRVGRGDLPALLRSTDLAVCAPWYEPFGIVPLEAMACGVPVVATAVGGLVDTVVPDVTGVHVSPHRPAELAAVLAELLPDAARRAAMGRAGADRAQARYGWDRIAAATREVYLELAVARYAAPLEQAWS